MENNNWENEIRPSRPARSKILHIAGHVVIGVVFAVIFALVFALFVQFIWNAVMPELFGLNTVNFWQAFGIIILAKLLFGGFGHNTHDRWEKDHSSPDWHRHWDHLKETESPPGWHNRNWKDYKQYWQDQGKAAFEAYMNDLEKKDR